MTFRRTAKVIGSIALIVCIIGIVFLSTIVQTVFQGIEEQNLDDFLSGKTNIYKGFDYAVTQ